MQRKRIADAVGHAALTQINALERGGQQPEAARTREAIVATREEIAAILIDERTAIAPETDGGGLALKADPRESLAIERTHRILFALFSEENPDRGVGTPLRLREAS